LAALAFALLLGIPAGVIAAVKHRGWEDHLTMGIVFFGISVPTFVFGPLLIFVFSLTLYWLPPALWGTPQQVILPAITLGLPYSVFIARLTRTEMIEVLEQDYIRTARAKGLPERTVVYRHALRNAMIPVLTVIGLQFGALLAGAIVTETIFSWPGIGRLTIQAISNRDYYLVQGCILAIGLTYIAVNFCTDLLYSVANPRIRQ
jgi:peptide/nickel transport system permease protein